MKLFAQIGHGLGDKVSIGLSEAIIDGAIFSPKDLQRSTMRERITELRTTFSEAELFIDPQFYLSLYSGSSQIKLGKADDWTSFKTYRKNDLELTDTVDEVLKGYYEEISEMEVTGIIAPGIYISQSFDSREAVIAKNFIRRAKQNYSGNLPLYASLAICREALQDQREFEEFLNDITLLSDPPDGFYIIIGSRATEARSDIFHADVIANWMMLNRSLAVNDFKVINGYSDILTPFLKVAGGYAGATGWWSNLRTFSMDRFFPSGGGRLPISRYMSKKLLNRITVSEKDAIKAFIPEIINGLSHDKDYDPEPARNMEVLQSWEALKSIADGIDSYKECFKAVQSAQNAYAAWARVGLPLDSKSDDSHIEPMLEGLRLYKERSQL
ncbi:MAG: hypothetical protein V2B19_23920 [Pseudomonadota bacterium]